MVRRRPLTPSSSFPPKAPCFHNPPSAFRTPNESPHNLGYMMQRVTNHHTHKTTDVHRHGLRSRQLHLLPDGRNFQVEYAVKAVENGGTSIGIRCKDGVVLAVEKVVGSKLLKHSANKRIATVDRHLGVVYSGMVPDGRHFVDRARDEARAWRDTNKTPIPTADLASRMGGYMQAYTLYQSVRPFGITAIVGGFDSELELPVDGEVGYGPSVGAGGKAPDKKHGGPFLYMIEPSGLYWGYYGAATGKGRQAAKAELEKLDLGGAGALTLEQAVKEAARIIYLAHDDNKDKEFELEMSWISASDGPTKGKHQEVPKALREEAERLAKKSMESDDEDDDKKDDDKMEE
ncbi:nucleophile aminohydrolase [Bombardia bombarda]|uniref:Nucleophile aminohydrolase n=1 Tax=Bombardia bombarda TaxID=252184 RepID=A0AA39X078_9PEZI|nr:nucleophile aminohydrolase [Bombardia bombarda]